MKQLTLDDIEWSLTTEPEIEPIKGNASAIDPETDAEIEKWILEQLDAGNQWAWCTAVVRGRWQGLEEWISLGCCSYESEESFKGGGYYDDMRDDVLIQLQKQAERIANHMTNEK